MTDAQDKVLENKQDDGGQAPHIGNLPLFYKKPVPLNLNSHAQSGLSQQISHNFAANTNAVMLAGGEFMQAARYYPIAFSEAGSAVPFAIVGLKNDENLFVDGHGVWDQESYIPAYVRRYPYIFLSDSQSDKFILCVDELADNFEEKSKAPFFSDGKPSDYIKDAMKFCEIFQAQYANTLEFGAWLDKSGILEDRVARAELEDGQFYTLRGFRLVNPDKMKALTDEQVLFLHKRGWLALLILHLQSIENWGKLTKMASKRSADSAASANRNS